ncbi:MAG: hypothetical protein NC548_13055 [Lachnospiraceae bacterium]|nr:hypothetical protein [Lachnospiraceae bacterium]MCM1230682.1 hypothetical protein [Ruminococcus flavefaciens]
MGANEYIQNQKELLGRVDDLESSVDKINILISRIGIDTQQYVKANDQITPGIACKIAFDQYGLVRDGSALDSSDIPELPMEKIIGLKDVLERKAEKTSKREVPMRVSPKKIVGTGIKVNYDEDGKVVSTSDLLPSDIPELPIEKVNGLLERLAIIEESRNNIPEEETYLINSGCGVKITYDNHGRVVKSDKLTVNDIPQELLARLNILESGMTKYATSTSVSTLQESLSKKLDANDYLIPGTYLKVIVDSKGLVIGHEEIQKKDLPDIEMNDVIGLEKVLRGKAEQSTVVELHNTVEKLAALSRKSLDTSSIKSELAQKADKQEVTQIRAELTSLNTLLQEVMDKIPNDTIIEFLNRIQSEVSSISGRVATLENKLSEK